EFKVNTASDQAQNHSDVAMDAVGDFVIAWQNQDGDGTGNYAQRYNAAGVAQGAEFKVNTYTTDNQDHPNVAMDATGDFVIAWSSQYQDGSGVGVYAQRYSAGSTTVVGVTTSAADGNYGTGAIIDITVTFSQVVTVGTTG